MAKETTATTKMGKLDTHLSSLWVLAALFVAVFVTICIYVYAGKQSDLPDREFPNTTIKGNLTVEGVLEGQSRRVINLTTNTTTNLKTSESGSLITLDGGADITLPRVYARDIGIYFDVLFLGGTDASTITTTGIAALSDDMFPGSVAAICTVGQDGAFISAVAVVDTDNTATLQTTGAAVTDVGVGSTLRFTAVKESAADANVWLVEGTILTTVPAFTGADIFTPA